MARGRCDHNPSSPRLALVVDPIPTQPKINRDAIARSPRLYTHPHLFPELTGQTSAGAGVRLRARRSSRREAWALMSEAIARHTDRRTFRIGDQRDDGLCNGVSVRRYQQETGLSRGRVNLTLREFEAAHYIETSDQPVEAMQEHLKGCGRRGACACPPLLDKNGKQRYRAFAAQRRVTDLFWKRHAFTAERVERARARAYQEWRRRREPPSSAVAVLEGRRAISRLAKQNRRRLRRLEDGRAPASSATETYTRHDPARQGDRNRAREARLESMFKPPGKPPSSQS